jgi:hypothetical protein
MRASPGRAQARSNKNGARQKPDNMDVALETRRAAHPLAAATHRVGRPVPSAEHSMQSAQNVSLKNRSDKNVAYARVAYWT